MAGVRCGVEIVELTNVDRKAIHRRYQDPGAAVLVLTLRSLDAAFAALKKNGVRIVTTGGAPVQTTSSELKAARAVTVLDPDGHYVELVQPDPLPETTVAASSNVIGIGLRLTVADAEKSAAFYRTVLGIEGRVRPFESTRSRLVLAGLPESAEYRTVMIAIPGSSRTLELVEFRGAGSRKSVVASRVQDPGSYRLQLTFRDIRATLAELKRSGLGTISTGGVPVTMMFGGGRPWLLAIVPDPSNLFLIVQQAPS
jgi:catechol 2,3-dioxygenase-like lactoylglutathione lyase family enzyme